MDDPYDFSLREVADAVTGHNLRAAARLLNDCGQKPRLDENVLDGTALVTRDDLIRTCAKVRSMSVAIKLSLLLRPVPYAEMRKEQADDADSQAVTAQGA